MHPTPGTDDGAVGHVPRAILIAVTVVEQTVESRKGAHQPLLELSGGQGSHDQCTKPAQNNGPVRELHLHAIAFWIELGVIREEFGFMDRHRGRDARDDGFHDGKCRRVGYAYFCDGRHNCRDCQDVVLRLHEAINVLSGKIKKYAIQRHSARSHCVSPVLMRVIYLSCVSSMDNTVDLELAAWFWRL
jgi:hypothetical protein